MKKLLSVLFLSFMLGGINIVTWAAEAAPVKGEIAYLVGNEDAGWFNYQVTKNLQAFIQTDQEDFFRAGVNYRLNEYFGFKAGMSYDTDLKYEGEGQSKTNPFGEFNWNLPVGNNTRFIGKYDYDYFREKWQTYEATIRVEMFPHQYVFTGIRGDLGDWADEYDLNSEDDEFNADNKEMMIFIRVDFGWQWKKVGLRLRPLLYVQGTWLHDYDLTYEINDKMNVLLNMNSLYDKEEKKYRLGLQYKF